ncbi:hypothetical protein C8F04DRAFT_1180845 [Mycena alexandri]|uniref:KOW domain-containing protein n=1 Tax=Mycena alexandri TaxID=1745969 RepID=A0AAD6T3B6_9AGAR|nr:hypothetical protein C8F04DRAFT_1180845 [Mycena alexandri]
MLQQERLPENETEDAVQNGLKTVDSASCHQTEAARVAQISGIHGPPIANSTRHGQCRRMTPEVNEERPRKRLRVSRTLDARRFLDTEAREGDGSEDDDEEDEDDLAFLNDTERQPTSLRPRGLDSPRRDEDGETLAALAQQYELRARAERAAARGAGVSGVERVEERLAEIRKAPADEFESNITFRSRKGDAKVGQLALVESGRAVLVLLPREEQRWKLARLVVSAGSSLDKALSSEPPPSQEELALWDAAHGGVLKSAVHPEASMAVGVSSRVVVKWPDSAHHDKSGFVVAEDEQKGEARVRVSVRGEAVRTWHPRLLETLTNGSPEEVEDILVPRWTLRRHLLSVSDELRGLDRVRVLGGLSAGIVGWVRAIDRSEIDPEVTMWVVEGEEREMKVTMTEVQREFMRGDLVQVVAGPSTGKRGIIVGRAEAERCSLYRLRMAYETNEQGLSAGSMQPDLSTAERGAAAQRRRAGDLSTAELEKIKQGKVSAGEVGVLAATTLGTVAEGEMAMAEVEDVALRAMVFVLEDHVGFEQGEQRVGGWTLPSVTTGDSRAEAMCAADKRREEKEKKAMKGGKRFRGQPVWIVKPHAMKGRRGMVIDNHWTMGAGGVLTMVLTVRIEVTNAPVQVPEDQSAALNVEQDGAAAATSDLGFTDDEDEWEGRRTPEWEDGTTPTGDAWRPTRGEVAVAAAAAIRAATRIGEDEGRWLCIPRLQGKRVDVRVRMKTAGKRVSGAQVAAAGKSGFIELSHALTESALNTPMAVRVGELGKRVQIEPRWLIPVRTTLNPPWNNVDASIAKARERVVIIGPDETGERDREGEYAETCPNTEQMGNVVWVRFERVEGADGEWRKYPVESLCRSLNEDGTFTRKSRF